MKEQIFSYERVEKHKANEQMLKAFNERENFPGNYPTPIIPTDTMVATP